MEEQYDEQTELREFILGEVGGDRREELELRFLSDDEFHVAILAAEEELYQDFADGNLTTDEMELFEGRFAGRKDHQKRVAFARALRKVVSVPAKSVSITERLRLLIFSRAFAAAAILVAILSTGFWLWTKNKAANDLVAALSKAQRGSRPADGRLAGFEYAPKSEGMRGERIPELELAGIKARAVESVLTGGTSANLRQLALVHLAEGDTDAAITKLEKAISISPTEAVIHNDLAVALIAKGGFDKLTRAVEEIETAIRLEPEFTAAYFNRAIACEKLNLPSRAKLAWEDYLKRDTSSAWAEEARTRLARLAQVASVPTTPADVLRMFLESGARSDLEGAWRAVSENREIMSGKLVSQQLAFLIAERTAEGDPSGASAMLTWLQLAGRLERARAADSFASDWATALADLSVSRARSLIGARGHYRDAIELTRSGKYGEALKAIVEARVGFIDGGDPNNAAIADLIRGYLLNRLENAVESNRILAALQTSAHSKNYLWLAVQADLWIATNELGERRFSDASDRLQRTVELADNVGDLLSQQKSRSLTAETAFLSGRTEPAIAVLEFALELARRPDSNVGERWRTYETGIRLLVGSRRFAAAAIFAGESLEIARSVGEQTFEFTTLLELARITASQGDFDRARQLVDHSDTISSEFKDNVFRERSRAFSNLQRGHVERLAGSPDLAIEKFRMAADYYKLSTGYGVFEYEARRGMMLTLQAAGRNAELRGEIPEVIELFERYRTRIRDEQSRNGFFDDASDVYDIAIGFEFAHGSPDKAFEYSELARARSLLDMQKNGATVSGADQSDVRLLPSTTTPLTSAEICAKLPPRTQIIQFAVLPDRTLIWILEGSGITSAVSSIGSVQLDERVERYRSLILGGVDSVERQILAAELYEILLKPVEARLDPEKTQFIVPDKALFKLPFETLGTNDALIERFSFSYSPSANSFITATARADDLGVPEHERLLAVGDPEFDSASVRRSLQSLPSALDEAKTIGELYGGTTLTRRDATKERILSRLKESDVFHFAGHYVTDFATPLRSALIVAGNDRDASTLANFEIIGAGRNELRLIVLSACDTGNGRLYNGEGMTSAARAFLATGVPLVVASQWPVDSAATKTLMTEFHRFRKVDGIPTVEALRLARLAAKKRGEPPSIWAAFITIGGRAS